MSKVEPRHVVLSSECLLDGWVKVRRVHYRQKMRDGSVLSLDREISSRGDGVSTLLYNRSRQSVLLLKQPRIVSTLRGDSAETIEACSGVIGDTTPEEAARREVIEETGCIPGQMTFIGSVYESPGGSSDLIHLFIAEYADYSPEKTWGILDEGEEIEVFEVTLAAALQLIRSGVIRDARTLVLLQFLALFGGGGE